VPIWGRLGTGPVSGAPAHIPAPGAARYKHLLQFKVVGADESSTEREPKGRAGAER